MGGFSIWHWLIVGIIILLLFGKGRFSDMMGDVAKGIKSFKKGMTEDEEAEDQRKLEAQRRLEVAAPAAPPADPPRPPAPAAPVEGRDPGRALARRAQRHVRRRCLRASHHRGGAPG